MACVLIVDDRPANRHYVAQVLAHAGHATLEAADGSDALEIVRRQRPDLVITDILMPVMDGVEFARRVRGTAELAATRIIFYTATYRSGDAHRLADACGVRTVIAKPAPPAALLAAVNEALAGAPSAGRSTQADDDDDDREGSVSAWGALGRSIADGAGWQRGNQDGGGRRDADADHARLRRSAARMAALMEVTLDLAAERERHPFLRLFCDAGLRIFDAAGVTLALLDEGLRICVIEARGVAPHAAQTLLGQPVDASPFAPAWRAQGAVRLTFGPGAWPGAGCGLGVRLEPSEACSGGALLLWRAGGGFDDDDEMFALAMAAEFAVLFQLLETHASLSASAADLRLEAEQRRRSEAALARSHRELAWFSERLLDQEKRTTRQLAMALHDELGQTLAAMRMVHDAATARGGGAIGVDDARRLSDMVAAANRQVREVLQGLRPPLLDEQGLVAALDNELRDRRRWHPEVVLELSAPAQVRWPADVEYAVFMVAREALNNALHHARPGVVAFGVDGNAQWLTLCVVDDGIGMPEPSAERPGHLGLIGMRERARAIGAELRIESSDAAGTTVALHWRSGPCDTGST